MFKKGDRVTINKMGKDGTVSHVFDNRKREWSDEVMETMFTVHVDGTPETHSVPCFAREMILHLTEEQEIEMMMSAMQAAREAFNEDEQNG